MGCVFGVILTTGAPAQAYFLDAANGVRPAGMGDAFTGVADDANTVLFNPAGFARLSSYEFTGMYADLYHNFNPVLYTGQTDQLNYNFLSLAAPVAQIGTFGVSWTHLYSTFYKENVFTLSYGRNLVPGMLDFGLNAKFLEWLVEANDYSTDSDYYVGDRERLGLTADVGLLFTPFEGFTLGASADNVIPVSMGSSGSEKVPLMWRAGAAFKKRWQESAMNSVQFSLEWEQRGTLATPKAGLELWLLSESIGLRGGVNTDQASGGLSYRYHVPASPMDIQLDYAFGFPFHILGTAGSHRAGLTARWGAEKTAPASDSSEEMPAELKPEEKPAADDAYQQALKAYYLGDYDASRQTWRKLLEQDPQNSTAQNYLENITEQENAEMPVAGNADIRVVQRMDKFVPEPQYLSLKISNVVAVNPPQQARHADEINVYRELAEKCRREQRLAEALDAWEIVRALSPEDAQAVKHIDELETELRQRVTAEFTKGFDCFNRKDYLGALRQFRAVLRVDPANRQTGIYLDKTKEFLNANLIKSYAEGIRAFKEKNYISAKQFFEMVKAISPGYQETEKYNAAIQARLKDAGRVQQIIRNATNALRRAKLNSALKLISPLMRGQAVDQETTKLFDDIIARKALAARSYERGVRLFTAQDYDGAISNLSESFKLDREGPAQDPLIQVYVQKGILEYRRNRLPEALAAWEKALPLEPNHAMLKLYIQRAQYKMDYLKRNLGEKAIKQ